MKYGALIAGLLLVLLTACDSASDTIDSLPTAAPSSTVTSDMGAVASTTVPAATTAPQGTVELVQAGFSQSDQYVYFAFVLRNTDPAKAFERVSYQVNLYDAQGAPVGSDGGTIPIVMPNSETAESSQVTAIGTAARIEVAVSAGDGEKIENASAFAAAPAQYQAGPYGLGTAVGSVVNPFAVDLKNVEVFAVLYDAQDQIVGGGFTFVDLLPAGASSVVSVSILATPDGVARATLYPQISNLTLLDLQSQ